MGEACSTVGEIEVYTGFWWRNLRELRRRWEDNIKLDLQKVVRGHGQDWDGRRTLANTVMNLRVP
jgi:hypothetical protein